MTALAFHKVLTLPGTLDADAVYFVQNGNYAETYVTDSAGVAKYGGNSAMIDERIAVALAGTQGVEIVADIDARDTTFTGSQNKMALVIDASADGTVVSGSAYYAYRGSDSAVFKVAEFESMDLSFDWASLTGAPTSTPAAIDQAVTDSHTHANKAQLDLITEVSGLPLYNGVHFQHLATANW